MEVDIGLNLNTPDSDDDVDDDDIADDNSDKTDLEYWIEKHPIALTHFDS